VTPRGTGIGRKLLRSHLAVAILAAVVPLAGLVVGPIVYHRARVVKQDTVPGALAAARALSGVRRSEAALRGWIELGEVRFREARRAAWRDEIRPAVALLEANRQTLSAEELQAFDGLPAHLWALEDWQWHVEDVAGTPGNEPARVVLDQRLTPLYRRLVLQVTGHIESVRYGTGGDSRGALIKTLADVRAEIAQSFGPLTEFVTTGVGARRAEFEAHLSAARAHLASLPLAAPDHTLVMGLARYREVARRALGLRAAPNWDVAAAWMRAEVLPRADSVEQRLGVLSQALEARVTRTVGQLVRVLEMAGVLFVLMTIVLFAAAPVLARRGGRLISEPVLALSSGADALAAGALEHDLPVTSDDEIGGLTRAFNRMRASLQAGEAELAERNRELAAEAEGKAAAVRLGAALQGAASVDELAQAALDALVDETGATAGLFYVRDGDRLRRAAAHGTDHAASSLEPGAQGLLAQAVADGRPRLLEGLPAEHLPIVSGLGSTAPVGLSLVPVVSEGEAMGVVELASHRALDASAHAFVVRSAEQIAAALHRSLGRARVEGFLMSAREQAAELQAQQEELRATNEELESQTEALQASRGQLQSQQEELRATNEELETQAQALEAERNQLEARNEEVVEARRQLEAKARALEETNAYKSQFLANMSHELRTPLNSILILSRLLGDNASGNLDDRQVEFAHTIKRSGDDLLSLIDEVLDLAKVEAGRMELVLEDIEVHRLVGDLKDRLEPVARDKGLELRLDRAASAPSRIRTDGQRLGQILRNLLANALKFTEAGHVALDVVRPDGPVEGPAGILAPATTVAFCVSDTGIGIPADRVESVFEAFEQADGTTRRKYGGTGLGLSISRDLARLLGGEIAVDSEVGRGTRFTVYLPEAGPAPTDADRARPAPTRPPVAPTEAALEVPPPALEVLLAGAPCDDDREALTDTRPLLLVVDDDVRFAEVVVELGRARGFQCLVAVDGSTAVGLARRLQPAGIVLDVGLPDVDGWTVLDRLRSLSETRGIPVHFVSAAEDQHGAISRGALGFLQKPAEPEALSGVLAGLLRGCRDERLLVVEDDTTLRTLLADLFEREDLEVDVVGTADAAKRRVAERAYTCAIVDLGLPDGDGFALVESLHAGTDGGRPLPIVVHTGRELSKDELRRLRSSASAVVLKGQRAAERLLEEVRLFLRHVEAPRRASPSGRDERARMAGSKVLLVDDDIRNVFALTEILEREGIEVVPAENGVEALELLDAQPVDLVLMDMMMPEMDGFEATRRIRAQSRWRSLPVIALTAKAMKGDRERCLEVGASEYLTKPIDVDRLFSVLRVWLRPTRGDAS